MGIMGSIRHRIERFAPRREIGGPATYTWDETARRFRDKRGKVVSRPGVRSALDEYIDRLDLEAKALTSRLVEGSIEIGEWQIEMERLIKRGHTSAAAIAKGGWKQVKPADWGRTGAMLRFELGKLNGFARELEAGLPLDGRVINRARMYAIAPTKTYEAILRRDDIRAGFDRERRILHSQESCRDCYRYHKMGWQQAGVLPGIGEKSRCMSRCRCTFQRERTKPPPKKPRKIKPPPPPKPKPPPPPKPAPEPAPIGHPPVEDFHARIAAARQSQRNANAAEEFDWEDDGLRYHALRRKFPDLIRSDIPITERLAKYRVGDEKVRAIVEVGKRFDARNAQLEVERADLNAKILAHMNTEDELGVEAVKYSRKGKPPPPDLTRRIQEADRQRAEWVSRRNVVRVEQESLTDQKRIEAHAFLMTNDSASFFADSANEITARKGLSPLTSETQSRVGEATTWLKAHVSRGDESTADVPIGEKQGQRAYVSFNVDHMAIDVNEDTATVVHEFGHVMEGKFRTENNVLGNKARQFLAYRVGNEPLTNLRDKFGQSYDADEWGRKDKFDDAFGDGSPAYYVGKSYSGMAPPTEIISMGIEKIYRDPVGFASKDPEYFRFIAGIMDGSLR